MSQTIFDALRRDHDRQRTLLDTVANTSGDEKSRRIAFRELRRELSSHANAEERAFYSRLLADKSTQNQAGHSVHEHELLDDIVNELKDMEFSNPNWIRKFETLADKVRHHLEEEERSVFPLAGKVLGEEEKIQLADKYLSEKRAEINA